jgi:YVTN family beta-propeller protein
MASRDKLGSLASANGSEIFGVDQKGGITRLSPEGDWEFTPPDRARWVFPQPNGAVVIAGTQGSTTHLWLIRPTSDDVLATAALPAVTRGVGTRVGDRLYFTTEKGLTGVLTRDLSPVKSVALEAPASAVAPTPSGDRLYVALRGENKLAVIDRYSESVAATVSLPGPAEELRMDPLGQHLLAKPAADGDSAWLIAVGTNKVSGTVRTAWRSDLPAFIAGGAIATARGGDLAMVAASDLRDGATITGGAGDFWYFFAWNGFRPRSADLDRPVTFDTPVSYPSGDSTRLEGDTLPRPSVRDAAPTMVSPGLTPSRQVGYMVSFAAVLSEGKAAEVASGISVNGVRPHVVSAPSGSATIYRVVLGPYASREEADRVGRESQRQYWVYEESQ